MALGNRGMSVEFLEAILASPGVFSDHFPVLWSLSPEEGTYAVTYAVGINCKRGETTENQGSGVNYMF